MYVIKIGGGAAIGEAAYARFAVDLAELHEAGTPFVVVHGGNAEFSRFSDRLGMPPRMITNDKGRVTRYTDRETIDAMLMAYCGKVNKTIVAAVPAGWHQCRRAQRHRRPDRDRAAQAGPARDRGRQTEGAPRRSRRHDRSG